MIQHLDELTVTLIADGEEVAPEAAAHAAVCATCAARVDAIRADALVLGASLAVEGDELQLLLAAALPQALAAQMQADARAARRQQLANFSWSIVPLALAYAGWTLAAPWLWGWIAALRQAGVTAVVVSAVADLLLGAADGFASIVEAASVLPGFDAPLVSLSVFAALTYVALLIVPRRDAVTEAAA